MTLEEQIIARDLITKGLACLTAREADVFVARCLGAQFRDIAADQGFSVPRARELFLVVMKKVRSHLFRRYNIDIPPLIAELEIQREHHRQYHEYIAEMEQARKNLRAREVPFAPSPAIHPLPPLPPNPTVIDIYERELERLRLYRRLRGITDDFNWWQMTAMWE